MFTVMPRNLGEHFICLLAGEIGRLTDQLDQFKTSLHQQTDLGCLNLIDLSGNMLGFHEVIKQQNPAQDTTENKIVSMVLGLYWF